METEKTVGEILAVADEVDGMESRCERHNRLNELKIRLDEWIDVLACRHKGPSLREMDLIVEDIENMLEDLR